MMERYDMYCQGCNANIYNALIDWIFIEHYYCPQVYDNWNLIKKVYPKIKFVVEFEGKKVKSVNFEQNEISDDYLKSLTAHIEYFLQGNGGLCHISDGTSRDMSVESIELRSKVFFDNFLFDKDKNEFTVKQSRHFGRRHSKKKETKRFPKKLVGVIVWHEHSKKDEYYEKAHLINHKTHLRNGRHVLTYNMCPKCAKELSYKCDLCKRTLKKEEH